MIKLFIFSLLLLTAINAQSFEEVNTGTYNTANLQEINIQECIEEIEYQYTDMKGNVDYTDISVNDINLMEIECIKENK